MAVPLSFPGTGVHRTCIGSFSELCPRWPYPSDRPHTARPRSDSGTRWSGLGCHPAGPCFAAGVVLPYGLWGGVGPPCPYPGAPTADSGDVETARAPPAGGVGPSDASFLAAVFLLSGKIMDQSLFMLGLRCGLLFPTLWPRFRRSAQPASAFGCASAVHSRCWHHARCHCLAGLWCVDLV